MGSLRGIVPPTVRRGGAHQPPLRVGAPSLHGLGTGVPGALQQTRLPHRRPSATPESGLVHRWSPRPYPGRRCAAPAERSSDGHVLGAGIRTARGGVTAVVRVPSAQGAHVLPAATAGARTPSGASCTIHGRAHGTGAATSPGAGAPAPLPPSHAGRDGGASPLGTLLQLRRTVRSRASMRAALHHRRSGGRRGRRRSGGRLARGSHGGAAHAGGAGDPHRGDTARVALRDQASAPGTPL
jgi:hypothetical protein